MTERCIYVIYEDIKNNKGKMTVVEPFQNSTQLTCRDGGIGRHEGLKKFE
jgi:hypothetical protein